VKDFLWRFAGRFAWAAGQRYVAAMARNASALRRAPNQGAVDIRLRQAFSAFFGLTEPP
jgi:hypothetical protein